MGNIGPWQIIIVAVVVVLLFGRGKISELMGDVAKGIKSFKKGLKEEEADASATIQHNDAQVVEPAEKKTEAS
jgi:sec-independent protein translocase protein TatA